MKATTQQRQHNNDNTTTTTTMTRKIPQMTFKRVMCWEIIKLLQKKLTQNAPKKEKKKV